MNPRPLLVLGLLLSFGPAAWAQHSPEKALASFTVSAGLDIALFAAEPMFVNPTSIDIDHKGRVWVCESVNYRTQLRKKPVNRAEGDRIVVLEDADGDGKADKATTFYQASDFLAPLGIAVAPNLDGKGCKVYVCHSPDILLFEDADGDAKADGPPKKLLSGFRGYDHDHGVHGILIGPDGKLYFSVGDQGVSGLVDKHGKKWTTNSTDCRAGTVWRCDLDGKNLELLAHNFRNNYEPCVDSFGSIFISDNDDDGNQQTRICYVMPGGNYGYHPRGPGQTHWHEEQPGVVPKILRTYFGSPCGMCVYEGTLLPEKYRGQLLHVDSGPRHLRCYHLTPHGAGYLVQREDMVQSSDNWFRPSDVCVAPDGSVFVADWYDPGVGGHGMGDTTRGRIYRVTPKGHQGYKAPKVDVESKEGFLAAVRSPNLAVRHMATDKLSTMAIRELTIDMQTLGIYEPVRPEDRQVVKALSEAASQQDDRILRARALWQLMVLDRRRIRGYQTPVTKALDDKEPQFRILALRALKESTGVLAVDSHEKAQPEVQYPDAAVRREILVLLRDEQRKIEQLKRVFYALAKQYDGKDRFYLCAIGIAVGQDPKRREVILADFDKHFPEWNDAVADLVWELRPPSVMATLDRRLLDAKIPPAQRARIVDILATSDDKNAGAALLKVLQGDVPPEVRERVVENLKLFLPGKWRDLRQSKELAAAADGLLAQAETRGAGLALMAAAEMSGALDRIAAIARDEKESPTVRAAAVQTLGSMPTKETVPVLEGLLKADAIALRNGVVEALGRLADPQAKRDSTEPALRALQNLVTASDPDPALRQAALAALASGRAGTEWLLDLNKRKQLPDALRADAGRLLRNSPYLDLRNRALIDFPPAKFDPKNLPEITTLLTRQGNPERGKQLLAATVKNDLQCLKCHIVRGFGGSIGPDLSVIGKKASRENLFESILYPSKAVADQYVSWQIATNAGQSLIGLLVEETPKHVILRDANGKDTRIARKEIAAREKAPASLMPADLMAHLNDNDLVDMVEYLFTLKTPALALDYWHIAAPFANLPDQPALDTVYPPEKGIDLKASYGPVRWRTVKPDDQGYVDLQAYLAGDKPGGVSYLYRAIESPMDQEAVVLFGATGGCKLWVNGALAHTGRAQGAAVPEQESVRVRLKKGVNPILIKIAPGAGAHGFYFTVLAEQELKRGEAK